MNPQILKQMMKPTIYKYEYGLPYSQKLGEAVNYLTRRVKGNLGAGIIVCGFVGSGKTTLGVELCDQINKESEQQDLDLNKPIQYAAGGDEFQSKLRQTYERGYHAIAYDEAGDFTGRGAISFFNKRLIRTFDTIRAYKIIPILILPAFEVLDKAVLQTGLFRLLINVERRLGWNQTNLRCYSLNAMFNILKLMEKLQNKAVAYRIYNPNIYGHSLPLEPERAKQLEKITIRAKLNILTKQEIAAAGLFSYYDLAKKLARSPLWIRLKVSKLKLKHDRVIHRTKYFDESVLNKLVEVIGDANENLQKAS